MTAPGWPRRRGEAADYSRAGFARRRQASLLQEALCVERGHAAGAGADVMAWRYTWSCTSPAANTPGTLVIVAQPLSCRSW